MKSNAILIGLTLIGFSGAAAAQQVNVYNWSDYIATDQLKVFEGKTGIKVNYTSYDSNEILDAKLRTGHSGYDVVVPTASPFFVRQLAAGLFRPLNRTELKNWNNLDPKIMHLLSKYDPDNAHAVPWMWGTTGIGYNVAEVRKRIPDVPVNSLRMVFDPAVVSKMKDCGVVMLDSSTDVLAAALTYLGIDADSKKSEDLAKAAGVVKAVRPFVRQFNSSTYINALAGGDVCLAFGYSGDILQAADRAAKSTAKRDIAYAIPKEGALVGFDVAAIPKDAPNPNEALKFIDFMMDPRVAAASSEITGYANANKAATALMPKSITGNPLIYPPDDVRARFYTLTAGTAEELRERTRLWTAVKTGR